MTLKLALLMAMALPAMGQKVIVYADDPAIQRPAATPMTASGATTLAFPTNGLVAYDVTLTGNTTFSFTPASNSGLFQRITLIIRPGGFTATLPASSGAIVWRGGSPPTPSTSAVTVLTLGSTGIAPILGDL